MRSSGLSLVWRFAKRFWLIEGLLFAAALVLLSPFRLVKVVGDSMNPTYQNGEMLVARKFHGLAETPLQRGDLVVIEHEGRLAVKRVAYLPGEQITQGFMGDWVDDCPPAAYAVLARKGRVRTLYLGASSVYLRGDNTHDSVDSRTWGPIPVSEIRYVVHSPRPRVFFPHEAINGSVVSAQVR